MAVTDWLRALSGRTNKPSTTRSPGYQSPAAQGAQIDYITRTGNKTVPSSYYNTPDSGFVRDAQGYYVPSGGGGSTYSGGYSTGGGGGGGGGAYAPAPDPEAEQKQNAINDVRSKFGLLQNVFDGLFGKVDQQVNERSTQLNQSYDQQQDDLVKGYGKAANQTNQLYSARGLGDSSYVNVAQDDNSDIFNRTIGALGQDKADKLVQLGNYAATTKAQLGASKSAYDSYLANIDQYGLGDILNLGNNISNSISQGQTTAAGLGTNADFIGGLSKIAPIQQQGTAQLANKLQNLITSSAPVTAKKYIAQGLIKASTLNDANAKGYWDSYFQDLLSQNGA